MSIYSDVAFRQMGFRSNENPEEISDYCSDCFEHNDFCECEEGNEFTTAYLPDYSEVPF